MTSARFLLSTLGLHVVLLISFHVSSTNSFPISTISNNVKFTNKSYSSRSTPWNPLYSGAQDVGENDQNVDAIEKDGALVDVGGVLGTVASIVVLRSEFVLKTTGCGLPAGPFGVVGAIEGISYLGVVATCATAIIDYFSSDSSESPKGTVRAARRIATSLSFAAVVVGIAVLAFQLTDYGYIPNAVPMEGGMCK